MRKFFIALGLAILLLGTIGSVTTVEAKEKVTKITVSKKTQVAKAKKKVWDCYKKGRPFQISGKKKYAKKVDDYFYNKIKKTNNIKWCPKIKTNNKKSLKKMKREIKYLGLICRDLRADFDKYIAHDSGYFSPEDELNYYEKIADIMSGYAMRHMYYKISPDQYNIGDFERVYKRDYEGDCGGSSIVMQKICQALGFSTRIFHSKSEHHGWLCIAAVDTDGTKYWQAVCGSSFSRNMTWDSKTNKKGKRYTANSGMSEWGQLSIPAEERGYEYIVIG